MNKKKKNSNINNSITSNFNSYWWSDSYFK